MSKKFLAKIIVASVLAGGINFLPAPNFETGNFQVSVAHAATMQFSQPVKIGKIDTGIQSPIGGFGIDGATSNKGNYYTKIKKDNNQSYGKGVAIFGEGKDALYVHYDYDGDYNASTAIMGSKFGDKDISNTVVIDIGHMGDIQQIKTNSGITFYYISFGYKWSYFYIIGKRQDGKWIKYISSRETLEPYFAKRLDWGHAPNYPPLFKDGKISKNVYCQNDTIIVPYTNLSNDLNGEFRFKWDEAAQWFSVEQVKY